MDEALIRLQEEELQRTGRYYKHICFLCVPLLCVSCYLYGLRPLLLCGFAVLMGNLCDRLISLLRRRVYQAGDYSNESFALVITLLMPATVDWYVLAAAILAGALIGKEVFGGYGSYPFHPAAVGYAVAAVSWPEQVFRYPAPYANIPLWDASGVATSSTISDTLRSGGLINISALSLVLGEYAAPMGTGAAIVLASGRPTAGIMPLAKELGLDKKGGCILSYNGGAIIDCATGETLYRKQLDAKYVPQLCAFAREQGVAIITYNKQGVVTESPEDEWALKECFTCKLPMQKVEDLAAYVDYPICKMLITLDPARRGEVLEAGRKQFAGEIDLYPSSPFFIEAVPLGVAKDVSLGSLLESRGLTRDNLMACGDGLNDCSMIRFAGVGVAMQNAEPPVKEAADYVTVADNSHDGVAEAIEKFIF